MVMNMLFEKMLNISHQKLSTIYDLKVINERLQKQEVLAQLFEQ
jgi:hypothetical protein